MLKKARIIRENDDGEVEVFPDRVSAKPISSFVPSVIVAFNHVRRSIFSLISAREEVIDVLLTLPSPLRDIETLVKYYLSVRDLEVDTDRDLESLLFQDSVHTEEHELLVREKLASFADTCARQAREADELAELLAGERTEALKAGIYTGNGGGVRAEFAHRSTEFGMHEKFVAVWRRDYRVPFKGNKGERRKTTMKLRFAELTTNVRAELKRTSSAIALIRQENAADALPDS